MNEFPKKIKYVKQNYFENANKPGNVWHLRLEKRKKQQQRKRTNCHKLNGKLQRSLQKYLKNYYPGTKEI